MSERTLGPQGCMDVELTLANTCNAVVCGKFQTGLENAIQGTRVGSGTVEKFEYQGNKVSYTIKGPCAFYVDRLTEVAKNAGLHVRHAEYGVHRHC